MQNKLLTIVLIINDIDSINKSLNSIKNQTCDNFDVILLDKYHLTNYTEYKYEPSENYAIKNSSSKYIYFMNDSTILMPDFVNILRKKLRFHKADIFWFKKYGYKYNLFKHNCKVKCLPKINEYILDIIHGTDDKIYNRNFLYNNYIGFDLSKYKYDINHIKLNYNTFFKTKKKYYINDYLVFKKKNQYNINYIDAFKKMIEETKKIYYEYYRYNNDFKRCLLLEDNFVRIFMEKFNDKST